MFGLMRPAKSCGKPKTAQRMHYCGTCKTMGQQFGQKTRLLLNYDAVFLSELLSSISGENTQEWGNSLQAVNQCFKVPKLREEMPLSLRYAAAANVFLAELKLDDSIKDRAKIKHKFMRWFLSKNFKKAAAQLENWGLDINFFWQQIELQSQREETKKADFQTIGENLQHYSQATAEMTAALFAQAAEALKKPELKADLYKIGFSFGELVYSLDAFEDLEKDIFYNQFNPLALFFTTENGSLSESDLEQTRQFILSKTAQVADLFNTLPIENEEIEQFQARLHSNIALRLYRDRAVPQTFTQAVASRWENAKTAASELICAPNSWGKKLQYHFISVIFFILPTLSVEFSQQKTQLWTGLGILTAILASVGLAKSALPVLPKKKKRSVWQRVKSIFGRKSKSSRYCDGCDDCCEDCCDTCEQCGIILGVLAWIAHCVAVFVGLIILAFPWWMPVLWGVVVVAVTAFYLNQQEMGDPDLESGCLRGIYYASIIIAIASPIFAYALLGLPVLAAIIALSSLMLVYLVVVLFDWWGFRNDEKRRQKDDKETAERYAKEQAERAEEERKKLEDKKKIAEFFRENAKRPEIKLLGNGIQYEILNEGDPNRPKEENSVVDIKSANNNEMANAKREQKTKNGLGSKSQVSDLLEKYLTSKLPNVGSKYRFYIPPKVTIEHEGKEADYDRETARFVEIEVLDKQDPEFFTTPSGLRYRIISEGDKNKPVVDGQIIEQGVDCSPYADNPSKYGCAQRFNAPVWFKDGTPEKEAYDLMKYQGAHYYFYLPNQSLTNPSFIIRIPEK